MLVIAIGHGKRFSTSALTEQDIVTKAQALRFIIDERNLNEDDIDEIVLVDNNLFIRTIPIGEMPFTMVEDISSIAEMII